MPSEQNQLVTLSKRLLGEHTTRSEGIGEHGEHTTRSEGVGEQCTAHSKGVNLDLTKMERKS